MGWFDSLCKTEIIGWQDSLCRQSSGSPKQSFPFPSSWRPQSSGNSLSLPIKKTFLFKTHIYLTNFKLDITKCINLKWCFSPKDILKEDNWWKETHFRFDFTPKLSVWRIYLRLQTSRSPNVHHSNCRTFITSSSELRVWAWSDSEDVPKPVVDRPEEVVDEMFINKAHLLQNM